ncbi:MAG: hypothetical protein CME34_19610 [Gordonia sp.]|nr:hypothetical protein [Gordonia sp. (in: high G+C Gram-positive bacteria)]
MATREPGFVVRSTAEFGDGLRALRGQRGLRRLAREQDQADNAQFHISHAQLSRYERGEVLPPLSIAEHLDWLYEGDGWVSTNIRQLWRRTWNPWSIHSAGPTRMHSAMWPAPFAGIVWLKIQPTADAVGTEHRFALEWGPWMRAIDVVVPRNGALLFTGKAKDADGIPRTLNLTCDKRVFLLHGAGDEFEDEEVVVDLRRGWRIAPGEIGDTTAPRSQPPSD